jgi:hypothetical protein
MKGLEAPVWVRRPKCTDRETAYNIRRIPAVGLICGADLWGGWDLNPRLADYESAALTS